MADQKPGAGSRPALTTSDLDEAAAVIGDLYLPVVIEADAGQTLEVRLEALRLHSMTAGLLTCSQDAQIVTAVPDHFHVNLPLNGRVASRAGLDSPVVSTPQQAMVFMPGKPASISWTEGTTQLCLMITRTSIESAMQQLLGQQLTQSVQFSPVIDLMSGGGATVRAAMNVVLRDLENGIPADLHPRVGRHIEGLLVDHLLLGQPHNFSDQLLRPTAVSPSLAIDRAIQLLEASPEEAWSTVSLAGAVHLSVRALQRGFERKTGVPPHAVPPAPTPARGSRRAQAIHPGDGHRHDGRVPLGIRPHGTVRHRLPKEVRRIAFRHPSPAIVFPDLRLRGARRCETDRVGLFILSASGPESGRDRQDEALRGAGA